MLSNIKFLIKTNVVIFVVDFILFGKRLRSLRLCYMLCLVTKIVSLNPDAPIEKNWEIKSMFWDRN